MLQRRCLRGAARCGPYHHGVLMKARIMLDNAPFGPDDLGIARQAFDGATKQSWPDVRALPPRHQLVPDTKDPAEIQAIAVQEMTKHD